MGTFREKENGEGRCRICQKQFVTTQPSVKELWEAKEKDSIGLVLSHLAAVDGIARIANS